jgi:predicted amino acid dehydrogenase/ribosome-associated toxin RatA of RatAB toxin-antitoxin module
MPDKDEIKINVSKIISAPKWKIIRLLTKVGEFPSYIPTIKDASVIEKSHNVITTKWHIHVDNVPVKWIEQDTLDLENNSIYFRAVDGDLREFRGRWLFKDHPQGTEVVVDIFLEVGIPAISDFADEYVCKIIRRNFEAILDAFDKRLVSLRYQSYKRGGKAKLSGFGIIGHLYNFNHLSRWLKTLNPDFKMPSQEFIGHLFNISPSFKLYDILDFKSKSGQSVNGCFIVATFIPDMVEKDKWAIFSKVVRACKIAEKYGVGIVTLGGFASIVTERIGQDIANEVDVPVTTGNAFTAAMAIDGVLKAVELLNIDIASLKAAIIGGAGDIGSACARVLCDKVKQLTITDRTKADLEHLKQELTKKRKAQIIATADNESAVKDADIIIATASVSSSILKIDWFKSGAIICDVGYPKNIPYAPITREDILIFAGGLAKSPTPISLPIDIGLPVPDTIYGCFAEAIILALEKRYENFSFGRGNITPEKIDEIRRLGEIHGFGVSDFYWGDRLIDESMIAKVKEVRQI